MCENLSFLRNQNVLKDEVTEMAHTKKAMPFYWLQAWGPPFHSS